MSLTNSTNQRSAKEIFLEAIEQPTLADRSAFLDIACGQDPLLRQQVVELMGHHFEQDNFMGGPAVNPATALITAPITEGPGSRIGRYKLLQPIGEGGMGVVYMADQEEPVRRRVALKIIKLGMDTKQVVARFEAERQALAIMDHPNIASVLDGGATETGRPFFVMELVQGLPITDFCDKNHLALNERIKLFIPVCHAIQSAHQKGIIHRDLKPSNILVTLNAGVPAPKVIDFGVAKATNQKLTEKTLFTNYGMMVGTPAYMSPEQAELTSLDVDTRTDIYSLGVVLYELLTSTTPFPEKQLRSVSYREMQRIILEEQPERPSTRVSTMQAEQRSVVARNRGTSELALAKSFASDLDWIIIKCLEKDRARRYETANGLASDLSRHLNEEPVTACPPSNLYRLQKLVRRNKLIFAAGSAVILAMLLGLGAATWEFLKERQALYKADAEAAKSRHVAHYFEEMLKGVGPSVALGRDTTLLREILDRNAESLGKELKGYPEAEAELRNTTGRIYWELGEYGKAEEMQRAALGLAAALFGETNLFVARCLVDLGIAVNYQGGRKREAEILLRRALAIRRQLLKQDDPEIAHCLNSLAAVIGQVPEAQAMYRDSLAILRKNGEESELARTLDFLARQLTRQSQLPEAESVCREALELRSKLRGDKHPEVAASLTSLGTILGNQGRLAESEQVLHQALQIQTNLLSNQHPDAVITMIELVDTLQAQNRPDEAEPLLRLALAARSKLTAWTTYHLALGLQRQGNLAEAENLCREVLLRIRATSSNGEPPQIRLRNEIVNLEITLSRLNRARVLKQLGRLNEFGKENCAELGIPARETDADANLVDLSAVYNAAFKVDWHQNIIGNDLSELPTGLQQFSGTRFDVRGLVQVASWNNGRGRFPLEVTEIAIGKKCLRLHFLHGIIWGTDEPGTVVGKYVIHYRSGADVERSIVLGKDALDWWTKPPKPGAVPSLAVAWSGHNPRSRSSGQTIQLYKTTWENQRPDTEIVSFDLIAAWKSAAPFLVAVTVE